MPTQGSGLTPVPKPGHAGRNFRTNKWSSHSIRDTRYRDARPLAMGRKNGHGFWRRPAMARPAIGMQTGLSRFQCNRNEACRNRCANYWNLAVFGKTDDSIRSPAGLVRPPFDGLLTQFAHFVPQFQFLSLQLGNFKRILRRTMFAVLDFPFQRLVTPLQFSKVAFDGHDLPSFCLSTTNSLTLIQEQTRGRLPLPATQLTVCSSHMPGGFRPASLPNGFSAI